MTVLATDCPFCAITPATAVWDRELAFAIRDTSPVSPGHTLVVARRHVASWFEANAWEQQAIFQGVDEVKRALDEELAPSGYNIGFNTGAAAGQTVMHLHVHVIPRFDGDTDDPRGGVRGVIPEKQRPGSPASDDAAGSDDPFAALEVFVPGESDGQLKPMLQQAFRVAAEIDLLVAFVQKSGIDEIEGDLIDALARGVRVRLLTGDYLGVTHPHALQRLFTFSTEYPHFQPKLFRVEGGQVFHPKAYIFTAGPHGAAFVGSSNLSRSALTAGVEWNLRTSHRDQPTFAAIRARFHQLFERPAAETLTAALVAEYQERVPVRPPPRPEFTAPIPEPLPIQLEVLASLRQTRTDGNTRGLVVMATGLGKTFLSAFDFGAHGGKRALFVAHREEILQQAADTWAAVHPDRSIGFLTGTSKQPDADLVFASVQTLSRAHHLKGFAPGHFDYIIIDEFHHAAAASYRKLLAWFEPGFLLGLTATPDRLDGAALLVLCHDNLVARVSLLEGISRKFLAPFRYFGVKDEIDFTAIPWRSGRFDPDALTNAAATLARGDQALREYRKHGPDTCRSLIFCSSRRHADFIAKHFSDRGVLTASVHSGDTSAPRAQSLQRLRDGDLEAIACVDVFNEGVDLPDVNMILMLRPTESPIIFLQQLGRGLRKSPNKPALTVVDFIGNHRSFLVKPQALVALTGQDAGPGDALRRVRDGLLDLPEGCSVDIETAALDMLEQVAGLSNDDQLVYAYLRLRDTLGRRPTAREVFAAGTQMNPVKKNYGTWFDFVQTQGDLDDEEARVLAQYPLWFSDITSFQLRGPQSLVVLEVLDEQDWLHDSVDIATLDAKWVAAMRADLLLRAELPAAAGASPPPRVEAYLREFHDARAFRRQWFAIDSDRFVSRLEVAEEDRETFDRMTVELVDLRLREYAVSNQRYADNVLRLVTPIELAVGTASGNPVLRLDRKRRPDLPSGDHPVQVGDRTYTLRFGRGPVREAFDRAGGPNLLPSLLRGWFGATAGHPGTRHRVELSVLPDGTRRMSKRVESDTPAPVIPLDQVPYYSELAVACGVAMSQVSDHDLSRPLSVETERVLDPRKHFVVRASGDSMDGGSRPIRDGDLVLCEWVAITDPAAVEGRPVLLTGGDADEVQSFLKMPVRVDGDWMLRSANSAYADLPVDPGVKLHVVATVLEVVEERIGPTLWGQYDRDAIASLFGHQNNPSWRTGHRDIEVGDSQHTILMVNLRKPAGTAVEHLYADQFNAPDELQWESQATTDPQSLKGRRIIHHAEEGRAIHLFVRYHTKDADGKGEPLTYCGTLQTLRHEGERPIRVWFRLDNPLPRGLWLAWSDLH
jgi:superfamily II DNA or RNA helicase/diadenosine tetraphosphate (Ap4A) HIT family hydrolase/SOS-response transcriptional repressor LexA